MTTKKQHTGDGAHLRSPSLCLAMSAPAPLFLHPAQIGAGVDLDRKLG